jgi:hypothetical protein
MSMPENLIMVKISTLELKLIVVNLKFVLIAKLRAEGPLYTSLGQRPRFRRATKPRAESPT